MDTLHHRGDALQTHTSVHGGRGERVQIALSIAVVLHEDEIPNLDVTIKVIIVTTGRPTGDLWSMIVKNFRAGTTRAGITHLPKVILIEARQPGRIHADFIDPNLCRFIVANVNRYPQSLCRQS